jgi:hypothetical protein
MRRNLHYNLTKNHQLSWIRFTSLMVSPFLNCVSKKRRSSVSSVNDEDRYSNGDSVGQSVMTVAMYVYALSLLLDITRNRHLQLKTK